MKIFDELMNLLENSYAPYSSHKVASIVIDNKNKKYYGVNVENASFGATSCAERNAIFSAISSGVKTGEIREVHLIARYEKINDKNYQAYPCGICRQVISEASNNDAKVYIYNQNGKVDTHNIKSILPYAFKKDVLEIEKN